jgi:ParB-like nuclease domain
MQTSSRPPEPGGRDLARPCGAEPARSGAPLDAPTLEPPWRLSAGPIEVEIACLDRNYAHLRVREAGVQARLCTSLSMHGQRHPVLVVRGEPGRYVLIDGYQRVSGLSQLARDTVLALVLDLREEQALMYCHRMQTSSHRSALEDGWLLAELCEHGQSLSQIAAGLDRSVSWVSRRLGLSRALPAKAVVAVRRGIVPAHGAMKSLVPLARANEAHCELLCERLGEQRLSSRQIGALYAAYKSGDAELRERIAEAPLLFLEAKRAITHPSPEGAAGVVVRDLHAACAALVRAQDSVLRAFRLDPSCLCNAAVERARTRCTNAYETLVRHLEEPHEG